MAGAAGRAWEPRRRRINLTLSRPCGAHIAPFASVTVTGSLHLDGRAGHFRASLLEGGRVVQAPPRARRTRARRAASDGPAPQEQLRPQDVRVTGIERQHGGTIGGLSYGSLPLDPDQLHRSASSIPVRTFSHVEACAASCRGHRRECPWSVAELSRADRGFRRAWTARSVASITSCSRSPWPPPVGTVDQELRHAVTPSVSSTSDRSTPSASSGSSGIASPSAHKPIAIRPANEIALTRSAWCGAISASE